MNKELTKMATTDLFRRLINIHKSVIAALSAAAHWLANNLDVMGRFIHWGPP